jgi:hypothetical protein
MVSGLLIQRGKNLDARSNSKKELLPLSVVTPFDEWSVFGSDCIIPDRDVQLRVADSGGMTNEDRSLS